MPKTRTDKNRVVTGPPTVATEGVSGNRVSFHLRKVVNVGNYESVAVEYGEQQVVPDGEDIAKVRQRLTSRVSKAFWAYVEAIENEFK